MNAIKIHSKDTQLSVILSVSLNVTFLVLPLENLSNGDDQNNDLCAAYGRLLNVLKGGQSIDTETLYNRVGAIR